MKNKWMQNNKWMLVALFTTIFLVLFVFCLLGGLDIIDWNWLWGYLIAIFFILSGLSLVDLAVKKLTTTENYYLYVFFFILRIGLYVIPFLLAAFIPNDALSIFGVLVGTFPILFIPMFRGLEDVSANQKQIKKAKKKGED